MKRWQIEQILYLNESGKDKLPLPQAPYGGQPLHIRTPQKENILVASLRRGIGFLINIF